MRIFVYSSLLWLTLPSVAAAQEVHLQARAISVAPYGIDEDGSEQGVYFEFLELILQQLQLPYTQTVAPYARISKDLQSGKADITIMFRYPHLSGDVEFIHPFPSLTNVVIGDVQLKLSTPHDLLNKRVAYLRGARFSRAIDDEARIDKYFTLDIAQAVAMLAKNRVDAVIGPLSPILYAADELQIIDKLGKPFAVSERTPWLQISKKSPLYNSKDTLRDITRQLMEAGQLTKLKNKYRSDEVKRWLKNSGVHHN